MITIVSTQYRLIQSDGNGGYAYSFKASYSPAGRMGSKLIAIHNTVSDLLFGYNHKTFSHQPRTIYDPIEGTLECYWDANGNLSQIIGCKSNKARLHDWDEENRLRFVLGEKYAGYYGYDAKGERVYKLTGTSGIEQVNAGYSYSNAVFDWCVVYPNPYIVITPKGYTKHYYAGAERIATVLGGGGFEHRKYPVVSLDKQHDNDIINAFYLNYKNYDPFNHEKRLSDPLPTATIDGNTLPALGYQCNSIVLEHLDILSKQDMLLGIIQKNSEKNFAENDVYYYHGDHLGSASWITETNGKPIQYIHYAPYGELIENQRVINYDERYKFTGKERDAESGYDYFGARYYASPFSFWLSVDPLADKYPAISPYAYCTWNPVKFIDPDGRWIAVTANDELGVSYTIVGGNIDLRDCNVYVVGDGYNQRDGKPTNATILIQTATPFSFSDEKTNKIVIGSIINMNEKSGDEFISQFQRNEITLPQYIFDNPKKEGNKSGRNGGNCDFKHKFDPNYGMPISLLNGKIASARDIGNFAAGYLAARKGIPKILTMFAFDMYNNYQNNTIMGEPLVSKQAQRLGYNYGLKDLFLKYKNLFTNK